MKKFEYKIVDIDSSNYDIDNEDKMNQFGKDGWELVSTYSHRMRDYITLYFKREILE